MASKLFGKLDITFTGMIMVLILTCYILFRLIVRLLQYHTEKQGDSKGSNKKWTKEQVQQAADAGLINQGPGWTEVQKRKAKELGLMNDREWTPDEHELAREHGLLNEDDSWSHEQLQKAKSLGLI